MYTYLLATTAECPYLFFSSKMSTFFCTHLSQSIDWNESGKIHSFHLHKELFENGNYKRLNIERIKLSTYRISHNIICKTCRTRITSDV